MIESIHIHVQGVVQGVGFRPFVYRIARRNLISGAVWNSSDGVHIDAEAQRDLLDAFLADLRSEAPSASQIVSIDVEDRPLRKFESFSIIESVGSEKDDKRTRVSADLATCDDCIAELFDPSDRRYHYPFINCTNCGPRFTIIDSLPYDRPSTSMREFEMCDECASEYSDPSDRRFHAQPDACFRCGPSLSLSIEDSETMQVRFDCGIGDDVLRKQSDAIIEKAAELIREGKIVAIKGLGGYHLACDATNEVATRTLRERKRRYGKPLAVMVSAIDDAKRICKVNELEGQLLESSARPIVLLERNAESSRALAPSVAGTLHEIGVMLPYTPVQHLLMALLDFPVVMTSGNFSEEPIISSNEFAHRQLSQVADAFLDNNRDILSKYDDSVVRVINGKVSFVRRARGFAPMPISLPDFGCEEAILAVGPEQKSTFCLSAASEAFVSQHIGDLEDKESLDHWSETLALYERMFSMEPGVIAYDMHPEYLSTKWAKAQSKELIEVQHHHAHIAAVIAEQACASNLEPNGKVIGIALDGTGFGTDRRLWGGEILLCDLGSSTRLAHLAYQPLIGAAAAIKHPIRIAYGLLLKYGLCDHPGAKATLARLGDEQETILSQMFERNLNTLQSSSAGRLFDAFSALLGICCDVEFSGQAPMLLEAAMYDQTTHELVCDPDESSAERYRFDIIEADGGPAVIEPKPAIVAALDDIANDVPAAIIARRFHDAMNEAIVEAASAFAKRFGIETVAYSGGVFMNRYLGSRVAGMLESKGLTPITHIDLPANDGCISYGQSAVAAWRCGVGK